MDLLPAILLSGLTGFISNSDAGVLAELEGERGRLEELPGVLPLILPPHAEIDRLAPGAGWAVGVNHAEAAVGGEVDIKLLLVLAEIGSPDRAVVAVKRGGDRAPVHQVARVPDQQPGGVVKAGVGEVEVVADANGAGIGVVAAQDRIAVGGCGLAQDKTGLGRESEGGGSNGGVPDKAATSDHGGASLPLGTVTSKAIQLSKLKCRRGGDPRIARHGREERQERRLDW